MKSHNGCYGLLMTKYLQLQNPCCIFYFVIICKCILTCLTKMVNRRHTDLTDLPKFAYNWRLCWTKYSLAEQSAYILKSSFFQCMFSVKSNKQKQVEFDPWSWRALLSNCKSTSVKNLSYLTW